MLTITLMVQKLSAFDKTANLNSVCGINKNSGLCVIANIRSPPYGANAVAFHALDYCPSQQKIKLFGLACVRDIIVKK